MVRRSTDRTNAKLRMIHTATDLFQEGLVHDVLRTYYDAIKDADGPANSVNYHISTWRDSKPVEPTIREALAHLKRYSSRTKSRTSKEPLTKLSASARERRCRWKMRGDISRLLV